MNADLHTIDYLRGQLERRDDDYARLYAQAEDIKEQYRDCASELAASRRHLAASEAERELEKTSWRMTAQTIYLEQQRWQEMAELLWEELREWHYDECPTQREPGCICHRILAAKWDEIRDWGDDD